MNIKLVLNILTLLVSIFAFGQTSHQFKTTGTSSISITTTSVSICAGGSGSLTASGTCNASSPTTVGTNDAGNGSNAGGGGSNWGSTSRITASDNSYSNTDINKNNGTSKGLKATNYGFSIPLNATVLGVQVIIGRYGEDASSLKDNNVQLLVGGTASGTNKALNSIWSTSETAANYGATNDLWGATLTPSVVNASDFGVQLEVVNTNTSAKRKAYVDYIQIAITYNIAGTLDWYTVSSGGTAIASGASFNPVGVAGSGLTNTNMPGTTTYYVECATDPGNRVPANFVIHSNVPAPTVGAITQPDCVTTTGSVVLSGLPSGGTINPGNLTYLGTSTTVTGLAVGTYTFTVSNGTCTSLATADVVISPVVTNTWTTAWSNGTPNSSQKLVFAANYPPAIDPNVDITGCCCKVTAGANVVIKSGRTLTLTNELTVLGTLTFENNANLVQINAVSNSGNINYVRTTNSVVRNTDYTYWSSPVIGYTLGGVSKNLTKSDKYFSYEVTATSEDWKQESAATIMASGYGYIIRGPESTSALPPPPSQYQATFIGVPFNGTKSITPIYSNKSYLLGNPYPSAISADAFLLANNGALDGTLYFWTHYSAIQDATNITDGKAGVGAFAYTSDDYASYNLTGGVGVGTGVIVDGVEQTANRPNGFIAAGQGFFTSTSISPSSSSIVFDNSMRVTANNTQFFKTKNPKAKTTNVFEKNRIWLNMTNTQGAFKQTLVGYVTNATNGYDSGFDGESIDGNEFVDFYSINQDKNLVIQGRALPFDENDEVPLGYRTTIKGAFTIKIDQADGILANQTVYLEDKLENTVVDLNATDYTFNTAAGTFNNRFVLKYSSKTLNTANFISNENKLVVSNNNKQIKINSTVEKISAIAIYDLLGREIFKKEQVNNNELSINNLMVAHQTLIVKTTLQNGKTVTNKVVY